MLQIQRDICSAVRDRLEKLSPSGKQKGLDWTTMEEEKSPVTATNRRLLTNR